METRSPEPPGTASSDRGLDSSDAEPEALIEEARSWERQRRNRRQRALVAALAVAAVGAGAGYALSASDGRTQTAGAIEQRVAAAINRNGVLYYEAESETVGSAWPSPPPLVTQVWLQEDGSHQFVAVVKVVTCPNGICEHVAWETAGSLGAQRTLKLYRYAPTQNLLHRQRLPPAFPIGYLAYDPLATLRDALAAGTAHVESRSTLGGKHVITIEGPIRDVLGTRGTASYIVDAKTYRPVRMIIHHVRGLLLPLGLALPLVPIFDSSLPNEEVITFRAYDYLPATAHNLALASIRAQHPTAEITPTPLIGPAPPLVRVRYCNRPVSVWVNGRCVAVPQSKAGP